MKILFSLLSLLLLNKECDSAKKQTSITSNSETAQVESVNSKMMQDNNMTISYTAITRGTYKNVTVSEQKVIVNNSRGKEAMVTYPCSKDDWNEITRLLSDIDASKLTDLKAPSTKSHYDGALAATLKLTIDGKDISSPSFDHGNPPKEISELVNKLLSMAKMNKK